MRRGVRSQFICKCEERVNYLNNPRSTSPRKTVETSTEETVRPPESCLTRNAYSGKTEATAMSKANPMPNPSFPACIIARNSSADPALSKASSHCAK